MSSVSSCANAGSPFSQVKIYVSRERKGIFTTPKSDIAPDGWGKPYTDTQGSPIVPGTPGGEGPVRLISKKPGKTLRSSKTPGTQFFGEISWLGPEKYPTPGKGKWTLTYHGPSSRYFPQNTFSYGASPDHNNVYLEGKCIAVAPYPVLGAALSIATVSGVEHFTLVVICWNGANDLVLSREVSPTSGVFRPDYTSAFRNISMKMYDALTAPKGWVAKATLSCRSSSQGVSRTVYNPRTPWFFDATGTVAQCMREALINVARGDKNVEQLGYVRYKCTVGATVSLTVPDNEVGFTTKTHHSTSREADYTAVTVFPAGSANTPRSHTWEAYRVDAVVEVTGKYVIAVDYDGTVELLLTVYASSYTSRTQWQYKGIDPSADVSVPGFPVPIADSNHGDLSGDTQQTLAPGYIPVEGDGVSGMWTAFDEGLYLSGKGMDFMWLYRRLTGTQTKFDTGQDSPNDVFQYFCFDVLVYPHYISLVRPHMSCFADEWLTQYNQRYVKSAEKYFYKSIRYPDAYTFMDKSDAGVTIPTGSIIGLTRGWMMADIEVWAAATPSYTTHTFHSIDASWPSDYVFGSTEPTIDGGLFGDALYFSTRYPTIPGLLQSSANNYREGGHAEDCFDNFAASLKYTDAKGDTKYYNTYNGSTSDLANTTGAVGPGIRFYPLGES